jgi:hypothetical protein
MKGIDTLIAAMLVMVITIGAIALVFEMTAPAVDRSKEILLFQEAHNNLVSIDSSITSVIYQGEGAARSLQLPVTGGEYLVSDDSDEIEFLMDSPSQIYGEGVSNVTDGIDITGLIGEVKMELSYDDVDIAGDAIFGSGNWNMMITNDWYDSGAGKSKIIISVS